MQYNFMSYHIIDTGKITLYGYDSMLHTDLILCIHEHVETYLPVTSPQWHMGWVESPRSHPLLTVESSCGNHSLPWKPEWVKLYDIRRSKLTYQYIRMFIYIWVWHTALSDVGRYPCRVSYTHRGLVFCAVLCGTPHTYIACKCWRHIMGGAYMYVVLSKWRHKDWSRSAYGQWS